MKYSTLLSVLLTSLAATPFYAQSTPTQYDLRYVDSGGSTVAWVPAIQNQGTAEDCWTFASATAMNSNLLKNGLLPTSATAPNIQISSWHLSTTNGAPDDLIASKAFSENSNWGGWEYQTLGYVTRGTGSWAIPNVPTVNPENYVQTLGGGPVFESSNALNPFPESIIVDSGYPENLSSLIPPAQQPIAYQVSSMVFYDQGFSNNVALPTPSGTLTKDGTTYNTYDFTLGAADPQVAKVKAAILQYGAATTAMNASDQGQVFQYTLDPDTGLNTITYTNNTTATAYTDHEVTLIGWDDSRVITNNLLGTTTTGAWLVQNSWGSSGPNGWDNSDGTFWAAYDDASIGRTGVTTYELRDNSTFNQTVLQNELGPMDYASNYEIIGGTEPAWQGRPTGMASIDSNTVASILTPTQNGQLSALGIAIEKANVQVTLDIYGAWLDGTGPSDLLLEQTFTLEGIGYHVLDLASVLNLTLNDSFVVQLTYFDASTLEALTHAASIVIGDGGLHGNYLEVPHNLSYYLSESDGWRDFADESYDAYSGAPNAQGGVLFLKGITVFSVPEPGAPQLLLIGLCVLVYLRRKQQHT